MIVGTLSIQPSAVAYAEVRRERKAWILAIAYQIGDSVTELVAEYDDEEDATAALVELNEATEKADKPVKVGFGVASEADTDSGADTEYDSTANGGEEYREPIMARVKRAIGFR